MKTKYSLNLLIVLILLTNIFNLANAQIINCTKDITDKVYLYGNLNSSLPIAQYAPFHSSSFEELSNAAQYQTTLTIKDSLSFSHQLFLYFFRVPVVFPNKFGIQIIAAVNGDEVSLSGGPGTALIVGRQLLILTDTHYTDVHSSGVLGLSIDWKTTAKNKDLNIPTLGDRTDLIINMNYSSNNSFIENRSYVPLARPKCTGALSDFDGDGKQDPYIYRPEYGIWAVKTSKEDGVIFKQWGLNGDIPLAADYTGDGKADLVVWRPTNGNWYICKSENNFDCFNNGSRVHEFGNKNDRPILRDADSDGIYDISIFRPQDGRIYSLKSGDGNVDVVNWGLPSDIPGISPTDK